MAHIRIIDMPCGYGKSSHIVNSFDKQEKYIAVVPFLSEVDRFIEDAREKSDFLLTAPIATSGNKSDHCEKLIRKGKSIACTHALFYRLGTLASFVNSEPKCISFKPGCAPIFETKHLLDEYNLIVDEVINPFEVDQTIRRVDFNEDYIAMGLVNVNPDGRVVPTTLWDEKYEQGSRTFNRALYEKAKSGALYRLGERLFVLTIPTELFLRPKSVTIYTYLSDGSLLLPFLNKLQKEHPGTFTLEVERIVEADQTAWREEVANALTVRSIPGLEKQAWNHSAQLNHIKKYRECASIGHELRKFKASKLCGIEANTVMLTCARDLWHGNKSGQKPSAGRLAKHTRMFGHPVKQSVFDTEAGTVTDKWTTTGVTFVPNTTRGTNAHVGCTTAVYLYDQHPNPQLLTFLGWARDSAEAYRFSDAYALTELVQWLFRSSIRVGGLNGTGRPYAPRHRVTVYISSQRMRNLLINWLLSGRVCSGPVKPKGQREEERLARLEGRMDIVAA